MAISDKCKNKTSKVKMISQKLKAGTRSQTYLLLTEQKNFAFLSVVLIFNFWSLIFWGLPRFARNDRKGRLAMTERELPSTFISADYVTSLHAHYSNLSLLFEYFSQETY